MVGLSPTDAGLSLMVLMIALNVSAGVSGIILGKMQHYKSLPIAGLVLAIAATPALATWVMNTPSIVTVRYVSAVIAPDARFICTWTCGNDAPVQIAPRITGDDES